MLQIKRSVLSACRVRYLRCPIEQLPTVAELQRLVPGSGAAARGGPISRPGDLDGARDALASTVALRRAERSTLWQDSTQFHDSFFAADSRFDSFGNSDFTPFAGSPRPSNGAAQARDFSASEFGSDIGGVVVDVVIPAPLAR